MPMDREQLGEQAQVKHHLGPFRSAQGPDQASPHLREIDRCSQCGGVFFDKGEFAAGLREAARLDLKAAPRSDAPLTRAPQPNILSRVGEIDCPRCGAHMALLANGVVSQLHYDRCSGCGGLFFDRGELELLAGAGMAARLLASGEFD
jgi:Zn-finger nucleic acid-binding protein